MPNTTQKEFKHIPFSEEDVCIVSKADPCIVWSGTKVSYSGAPSTGHASGYNFYSGESDVEPCNDSGWGRIRIPELNQLHKIFVFPKDPRLIARADYTWLDTSVGVSGYPAGHGGCSGKMALIHYDHICSGCIDFPASGLDFNTLYGSGVYDIIAFGSEM